ncbi:hypothetical protein ABTY61_17150 [Kitasatospora sp. NPDC096128]|uniref:hypothetical protein n=1 Tax=Kitasatospora sp. NPDC096128 TaxID=3155547 RepID=UPI0033328407
MRWRSVLDTIGGGAFAAEEDGLSGAAGEAAEFGVLHGGELGADFGEDGVGEVRVADGVQGAAGAVGGFDQGSAIRVARSPSPVPQVAISACRSGSTL